MRRLWFLCWVRWLCCLNGRPVGALLVCVYAAACHVSESGEDASTRVEARAPVIDPAQKTPMGAGPESRWPYSVRSKIFAAEVIEIVSLYPAPLPFAASESAALAAQIAKQNPIDGYGVLGVAVLSDDDQIEALAELITAALAPLDAELTPETQHQKIIPSSCFWPRHALRFYRGAERVDVLLCFVCRRAEVIEHTPNTALNTALGAQGGSPPKRWTLALNGHPQAAEHLNALLKGEGVTLPDSRP